MHFGENNPLLHNGNHPLRIVRASWKFQEKFFRYRRSFSQSFNLLPLLEVYENYHRDIANLNVRNADHRHQMSHVGTPTSQMSRVLKFWQFVPHAQKNFSSNFQPASSTLSLKNFTKILEGRFIAPPPVNPQNKFQVDRLAVRHFSTFFVDFWKFQQGIPCLFFKKKRHFFEKSAPPLECPENPSRICVDIVPSHFRWICSPLGRARLSRAVAVPQWASVLVGVKSRKKKSHYFSDRGPGR